MTLPISGNDIKDVEYAESLAESSHTGDTNWQDKLTKTFISAAGNYEIVGHAMISTDNPAAVFGLRIDIDGTPVASSGEASPTYPSFTCRTPFTKINLTAGSHTIKIQYRRATPLGTVYIKEASLTAKRTI